MTIDSMFTHLCCVSATRCPQDASSKHAPGSLDIEEEPPTPFIGGVSDTWMASINDERPPTPPCGRPGGPSVFI